MRSMMAWCLRGRCCSSDLRDEEVEFSGGDAEEFMQVADGDDVVVVAFGDEGNERGAELGFFDPPE